MTRVTLYSRPDCHLCEIVQRVLDHVRKTRPFDLEIRDIDNDPADQAKYTNDIPIIAVNGVEVARHHLTAAAFEAALDRARDAGG